MGATNPQHKLQFTSSFFNGPNPASGYDVENGNSTISVIQYTGANTNANSVTLSINTAKLQSIFLLSDKGCTLSLSSGNWNGTPSAEIQTISITGTPTGGSFSLVWNGNSTIAPYNTNASNLQTLLQAISGLNGNVNCTGGPLPGTAINATFTGSLNTGQQPLFVPYSGALTGGSSPTTSVTRATAGQPTQSITLLAGLPIAWGTSLNTTCPITSNVNSAYVGSTPAQNLQIAGLTL